MPLRRRGPHRTLVAINSVFFFRHRRASGVFGSPSSTHRRRQSAPGLGQPRPRLGREDPRSTHAQDALQEPHAGDGQGRPPGQQRPRGPESSSLWRGDERHGPGRALGAHRGAALRSRPRPECDRSGGQVCRTVLSSSPNLTKVGKLSQI